MSEFFSELLEFFTGPTVFSVLMAFATSGGLILYRWKKRNQASIDLLVYRIERVDDGIKDFLNVRNNVANKIQQGDPFREIDKNYTQIDKNYTPFILFTGDDQLSFTQISEIYQYLKYPPGETQRRKKVRQCLLEYFSAQEEMRAIVNAINSDFVRGLPQERKLIFWEEFIATSEDTSTKISELVQAVEKWRH